PGATPAIPVGGFPVRVLWAAMIPATWVPCATGLIGACQPSSSGVGAGGQLAEGEVRNTWSAPGWPGDPETVKLALRTDRSGWSRSIPVSITAVMTLLLPVDMSQACSIPVMGMSYCWGYRGSVGMAAARTR